MNQKVWKTTSNFFRSIRFGTLRPPFPKNFCHEFLVKGLKYKYESKSMKNHLYFFRSIRFGTLDLHLMRYFFIELIFHTFQFILVLLSNNSQKFSAGILGLKYKYKSKSMKNHLYFFRSIRFGTLYLHLIRYFFIELIFHTFQFILVLLSNNSPNFSARNSTLRVVQVWIEKYEKPPLLFSDLYVLVH